MVESRGGQFLLKQLSAIQPIRYSKIGFAELRKPKYSYIYYLISRFKKSVKTK